MATTSIWHVKNNLNKLLHYALNPEKTLCDPDATELQKVLHYAADPYKTEQLYYVSGVNCSPHTTEQEMTATKINYGKTGGRVAYHGYQSFKPGEVTPDEAHKMGVELARRLWGNRFEVVISTHTDKDHVHNHFVLNSVSCIDGKKFVRTDKDYAAMQEMSDRVCREYGKSVIEEPKGKGKQYAERAAEKKGDPTIRSQIAAELDDIISQSYNLNNFFEQLRKRGYKIRRGPNIKHTSIRPPFSNGKFRLDNLRGDDFTEANIQERIMKIRRGEIPRSPEPPPPRPKPTKRVYHIKHGFLFSPHRPRGFRALYFRYLIMLGKAGRRELPPKIRQPLREEVTKFEQYKRQFDFLNEYRIETVSQLDEIDKNVDSLIDAMTDRRADLYRAKRRGVDTAAEINEISGKLKTLRRERYTIKGIREKEPIIYGTLLTIREIRQHERMREQEQTQERRNRDLQAKRRRHY